MNRRIPIKERVESLAFRVRTSREDLGITQTDLAERARISPGHVSKLETGKITNPTRETIKALAEALEVPEAYLLAFIETSEEDDDDDVDKYMKGSPLIKQLIGILIQLPLRDQKLLVSIAQSMANIDSAPYCW